MATEPGSTELLDALVSRGVRVLVPVLRDEGVLGWTDWDPLRPVSWDGRPVPGADTDAAQPEGNAEAIATADAVLVPALAVAADGTRLGRGAGCYDRALRLARRGAPLGAVVFDGELCDRLPADPWDVAVTAVVSPQGWQDLAQPR
jgi:5-formyltetrahydrofolate cyclo-ligase